MSKEKERILQKNRELVRYLQSGIENIPLKNGKLYQGEISNSGLAQGKGIFKVPNKYEFNGDWVNGKPNGFGILKHDNGDNYEG